MFKKIFIQLCNQKGVSPSVACRDVGITPSTFSQWNDTSVPRQATLARISDYFGVSVDYLLGKEIPQKEDTLILSDLERQIVLSYRLHPNMHESICRLLDIDSTP